MEYEIFVSEKPADGRELRELKGLPVVVPIQYHGAAVSFVGRKPESDPKADALVTDSRRLWIGVLTADCLPVFLVGDGVVGIVHAGWRGTLKGITYSTVKYISRFSRVRKAILGVSICGKCYEVGKDVKSLFKAEYERCFLSLDNGKYLFDLKGANIMQLRSAGVEEIEDLGLCTVCHNNRFYSYRLEKTEKRFLSAIRIV